MGFGDDGPSGVPDYGLEEETATGTSNIDSGSNLGVGALEATIRIVNEFNTNATIFTTAVNQFNNTVQRFNNAQSTVSRHTTDIRTLKSSVTTLESSLAAMVTGMRDSARNNLDCQPGEPC
jgi:hypothetical protein